MIHIYSELDLEEDLREDERVFEDERFCHECGSLLKVGYESYEIRGHIERERIIYCQNCD